MENLSSPTEEPWTTDEPGPALSLISTELILTRGSGITQGEGSETGPADDLGSRRALATSGWQVRRGGEHNTKARVAQRPSAAVKTKSAHARSAHTRAALAKHVYTSPVGRPRAPRPTRGDGKG